MENTNANPNTNATTNVSVNIPGTQQQQQGQQSQPQAQAQQQQQYQAPYAPGWGQPTAPGAPMWDQQQFQPQQQPMWGMNPNQGAPMYNWNNPNWMPNNNGNKINPTTSLSDKDIAILKANRDGVGAVFYKPPKEGYELASYRCNHHGPNGEFLPVIIDNSTGKVQCPQCGASWIQKDPMTADIHELEDACSKVYDWTMSTLSLDINPNKTLYEGLIPTFISVIKQLPHMYKYAAAVSQKFYNQNGNGYNQYNDNNANAYMAAIMQGTPLPGNGMMGAMYGYNPNQGYGMMPNYGYGAPQAAPYYGAQTWPPQYQQQATVAPPQQAPAQTGWGAQAPMTYSQPQAAQPAANTAAGPMPNPIGQQVENVSVNIPGTQPSGGSFSIN